MQNETRITIYTGISMFLAALTIGLIIFGLSTRSSFSSFRDAEKNGREKAKVNMVFDKYNGSVISGAEVVAMIRDFYTEDIDIYIDKDKNGNLWSKSRLNGLTWTSTVGTTPAMLATYNNYEYDYNVLVSLFKSSDKYTAYLIYDSRDVSNTANRGVKSENSWVTGVQIIKQ